MLEPQVGAQPPKTASPKSGLTPKPEQCLTTKPVARSPKWCSAPRPSAQHPKMLLDPQASAQPPKSLIPKEGPTTPWSSPGTTIPVSSQYTYWSHDPSEWPDSPEGGFPQTPLPLHHQKHTSNTAGKPSLPNTPAVGRDRSLTLCPGGDPLVPFPSFPRGASPAG